MAATPSRRPKARGFTRIDQLDKRNHGWFVRVGYFKRRDGTWKARHVRFFSDFGHGGRLKAKRAAEAFVARAQRKDKAASALKANKVGKVRSRAAKATAKVKTSKTKPARGTGRSRRRTKK